MTDVGPKSYFATSMLSQPSLPTTALHRDMSDAVNVLTHCATLEDMNDTLFQVSDLGRIGNVLIYSTCRNI